MTTEVEYAKQSLADKFAGISRGLRSMADAVDRYANDLDRVGERGVTSFGSVAGNMQHDVLWGLASLGIDSVTREAAEGDVYRAKGL